MGIGRPAYPGPPAGRGRDAAAGDPRRPPSPRRAARLEALDALEQYAWAGDFPDNPGFVRATWRERAPRVYEPLLDGPRAPVFVDEDGTHCAVGYLMALDAPALVARIDEHHHTDFLAEIDTPGLADEVGSWAEAHGFTQDELAWIQPTYSPVWVPTCEAFPDAEPRAAVLAPGDACEMLQSAIVLGCSDTCEGPMELWAPARWDGEQAQTVTLDLGGLGQVEQELQPGETAWIGPLTANDADLYNAVGELRAADCAVSLGAGSENGGVDRDACPKPCGCSAGTTSTGALWFGFLALFLRRR